MEEKFPGVELSPILELIAIKSDLIQAPGFPEPVCDDPGDDKFLACALASKTKVIVSGDKHLLRVSGYRGIEVLRPSKFVGEYLRETS